MYRVVCLLSVAYVFGQQTQCVIVQHGTGAQAGDPTHKPQVGDSVTINYAGYLTNGVKFDSSYDRGKPFTTQIGVGQVIQGWDQGVPQLSLGETATLYISAACGYGAQGAPPSIPANADLIFNVNLLAINGMSAGPTPAPFQQSWSAPVSQPAVPSFSQPSFGQPIQSSFGGQASFSQPSFGQQPSFSAGGGASFGAGGGMADGGDSDDSDEAGWTSAEPGQLGLPTGWFPTPAMAPTVSHVGLPTCIAASCGRAISWDPSSLSTPLCLCNPLCQTMSGTPGVLPCCPGIQEVCLDPWRSPTPPTAAPPQQAAPQATSQALISQSIQNPVQAQPVHPTANQPVTQQASQQTMQQPSQQTTQKVTQQPAQPVTQQQSAQAVPHPAQPASQPVQPASKPVQPASQPAQPASQSSQVVHQAAPVLMVNPSVPVTLNATVAAAPTKLTTGVCQFSATKWAAKKTCADKRWTIRESKCKKSCDAAAPSAKAQYWPKTQAGHDSCVAALATCPK